MTARTLPNLLLAESAESWGDERERSVMLTGYAYVFILTQFLLWTVGAIVAWFIPGWVTVVLFLAFLLPSLEWQRFNSARDVDAYSLAYTGRSLWRTSVTGLYFGACAISMAVAVTAQWAPDDSGSLRGGIVGGIIGGVGAIVFGWWYAMRKAARAEAAPPDED